MARTASIGIRVTPELKEAADRAAADDRRSTASLWEKIMEEWLVEHGYLRAEKGGAKRKKSR